jgi:hypothetical protein
MSKVLDTIRLSTKPVLEAKKQQQAERNESATWNSVHPKLTPDSYSKGTGKRRIKSNFHRAVMLQIILHLFHQTMSGFADQRFGIAIFR